jgi:hypothetical protein
MHDVVAHATWKARAHRNRNAHVPMYVDAGISPAIRSTTMRAALADVADVDMIA